MKLLFTLLFSLAFLVASAQKAERLTFAALPVDSATHLITYTAVMPIADATKEQLYLRAKEWAARFFVDSKTAGRIDDKEAGTMVCRGLIRRPDNGSAYEFTVSIYTKDARYKYVIDQITYQAPPVGMLLSPTFEPVERWATYSKMNARIIENRSTSLDAYMKGIVSEITTAMSGKVLVGGKSNW